MKLELQISINRNIVECKDFRNISVCQLIFVLIETLWNVKTFFWKTLRELYVY